MHLSQVRAVAEPPRFGQAGSRRRGVDRVLVLVVQEPRELAPAGQPLAERDLVRAGSADHAQQLRRRRLAADRLRVEEHGNDRLLHFAAVGQRGKLFLDAAGLRQLRFEQSDPVGRRALARLRGGHARQLAHGLRDAGTAAGRDGPLPGGRCPRGRCVPGCLRPKQGRRADERTRIPRLGLAQGGGQRAEDAARPLEAGELRPAAVEDVGQVRVERETLLEPAFLLALRPGRRLVEPGQLAHRADRLGPPSRPVAQRLRLEEPAPQDLRHVLALDRLNALLPLPAEDVEEIPDQSLALVAPLLGRVGGEQRRHHRRPVHLGHRLRQVLEEVDDAVAPHAVPARLLPRVHEDLVDQDQRAQTPLLRAFQQLAQQRLRRRRFALLGAAVAVNRAQPLVAVELVGEHAPRVAKRTRPAIRRPHALDAAFDVDLVEAERRGVGAREPPARVLAELAYRRHVRQRLRFPEQVIQRDQRVRLAAAVGQFQLAHGLVALPVQPRRHVLDQLPQGVGRVGQREELLPVPRTRAAGRVAA